MGTLSGYKPKQLANCLTQKLDISFRSGHELNGWYWLDGRKRLRVTVPKEHSGDVSQRVVRRAIGSLRLSEEDFRRLYQCPMKGPEYEQKIRSLVSLDKL